MKQIDAQSDYFSVRRIREKPVARILVENSGQYLLIQKGVREGFLNCTIEIPGSSRHNTGSGEPLKMQPRPVDFFVSTLCFLVGSRTLPKTDIEQILNYQVGFSFSFPAPAVSRCRY